MTRRAALLALGVLGCRRRRPREDGPLRVAAAADLTDVFTALAPRFRETTGREVALRFGASGLLTRQVREGAPFDVLAVADVRYLRELEALDLLVPGSRRSFALGHLVIYDARDGDGPRLRSLAELAAPKIRRVALANPEHAPYGAAALSALRAAGVEGALRGRLVFGDNVRQALAFAQSGEVDAALVARSLCGTEDRLDPRCAGVDAALHPKLEQAIAVLRGGDERGGAAFVALLRGRAGQALLRRHGFEVLSGKDAHDQPAPALVDGGGRP